MYLIKNKEFKRGNPLFWEEVPVPKPCEQEIEHHIVGHQDIRRIVLDILTGEDFRVIGKDATCRGLEILKCFFAPGRRISRVKSNGESRLIQPFGEILVLAVGKRIHRIDNDCLDSLHPSHFHFQALVHDRDTETETFPGTGTGSDDRVGLIGKDRFDRFTLVFVGLDWSRCEFPASIPLRKDLQNIGMQDPIRHHLLQGPARSEPLVQLDMRRAPEKRAIIDPVKDPALDMRILDLLKGIDVGFVLVLDISQGFKRVHVSVSSSSSVSPSCSCSAIDKLSSSSRFNNSIRASGAIVNRVWPRSF